MRYAFVHKNFRELNFEKKVIFISHLVTALLCFFPWYNRDADYVVSTNYNAFSGPGFLIGWFVLLIALLLVMYFLDRLFESERVSLPLPENALFFGVGVQQILLIVLAWSVIFALGREDSSVSTRFGLFLAFVAQVTALVATFLNWQLDKQHHARSFFNHTTHESSEE